MRTIDAEVTAPQETSNLHDVRRRRLTRRIIPAVGLVAAAAVTLTFVVRHDAPAPPREAQPTHVLPGPASPGGGPQAALDHAADVVATTSPVGSGSIRHFRFRDDDGQPACDVYVRPDGSALVGPQGKALTETDGYLTSKQLASLPADPDALRLTMMSLSQELDYGFPGERPERAMYRLALDLLPDPGVPPAVKAGVYRVLAGFDLQAIHARDLGLGADPTGRPGEVVEFTFEEGYRDRLVLDQDTGALLSSAEVDRAGKQVAQTIYISDELVEQMPQQPA